MVARQAGGVLAQACSRPGWLARGAQVLPHDSVWGDPSNALAGGPEHCSDLPKQNHEAKLGHLSQANQGANTPEQEPHQLASQPSLASRTLSEVNYHRLRSLGASLELYIGSQFWIRELEVVGKD